MSRSVKKLSFSMLKLKTSCLNNKGLKTKSRVWSSNNGHGFEYDF